MRIRQENLGEAIKKRKEIEAKYRDIVERKGHFGNEEYLAMYEEMEEAGLPAIGVVIEGFLMSCVPS